MNRSIRFTALFSLFLIAVLLVNLTIIQAFSDDKYAHNPLNRRGYYELRTVARGQIYAGNTVLVQSTADQEGIYTRSYPETSPAFAPLTGYISQIYGASNLEASQNAILNGTDPALFTSNWMDTLTGKKHAGANVELTIDPDLQKLAYDQLVGQGYQGAAVAVQPSTGKILALASNPSFSAADVANPDTAANTWAALTQDPTSPLVNHATSDTLPPGSIFKIITTAAGLSNGFTPDSPLTGQASITLPGTTTELTNYAAQTCGGSEQVTLATAFALSCNTAFVEMSESIGADELRKYANAFGIGEQYELGIPAAPGSLGELADAAQTAQSAIGQRDVTMSALQAAIMAATVANKGVRMQPYLINKITDPQMKELSTTKPKVAGRAVEEQTATTIQELMFGSERNTWGYDGNGFASKTGTAEHGEGLPPHVWYVAFDPDRDIAVAVMVKDGGNLGLGATGGQVSSPIGRTMLRAYTGPKGGEQ